MMNNKRGIVVRAFVSTGKDGEDGMIDYIDRLERAVIYTHKYLMRRKTALPRIQIERALEEVSKEIDYNRGMRK